MIVMLVEQPFLGQTFEPLIVKAEPIDPPVTTQLGEPQIMPLIVPPEITKGQLEGSKRTSISKMPPPAGRYRSKYARRVAVPVVFAAARAACLVGTTPPLGSKKFS
jgi:hypothetical protein